MTKQLTIRGVTPELGRRLDRLSRERGESVNATVLKILSDAVGLDDRRAWLEKFATWSTEEVQEFDEILKDLRKVDDELWK